MDNMERRCVCGARNWDELARQLQCKACGRRERKATSRFKAHLTGRTPSGNPATQRFVRAVVQDVESRGPSLSAWLKAGVR